MPSPTFIVVDLFAGGGGTTIGFANTHGLAKVIAAINHDPVCIESHWRNHPEVVHFEEDIRTVSMRTLADVVRVQRLLYPNAYLILWASLECTNFSKAKGGLPRDADSRSLADHMDRYVQALQPDYFLYENVEEFMAWGPLDANGKPVSRHNGRDWLRWTAHICSLGYHFEHRMLNSADYGAYTSRKRLFGCFARHGTPIAWPAPTHSRKPIEGMFGSLQPWKPVKDVLQFEVQGESIFTRKKPLVEKTLERIYAGLIKHVAGGKKAFLLKYNSVNKRTGANTPPSVEAPCPVVSTQDRLGLVQAAFLSKYYSGNPDGKNIPVTGPAGTITTIDGHALVQASFVDVQYGNGFSRSTEEPAATITTKERMSLVSSYFIDRQHSQGTQHQSVEVPAGALLTVPKMSVVEAEQWIMNTQYSNIGTGIQQPMQTITASRHHHYLMNPQYLNTGGSVEQPCFTLIARMDKMPPYLVSTEQGQLAIEVYSTDSPAMRQIKQFMALYGIVDIRMRMLLIPELLRIQGFPEHYQLAGNQADQKKMIGNAVHPYIPEHWAYALAAALEAHHRQKMIA